MAGGEEREFAGLYLRRARAELDELASAGFMLAGNGFPQVLMLKGEPGPAEQSGAGLLAGPDGAALRAALDRLGYADDAWAACSVFPEPLSGNPSCALLSPEDLAWAVEAFDPELVLALDDAAAQALARAWGLSAPFEPGALARVRGRRVLALGGFEAALSDPKAKQLAWARLKQVPPLRAPL